MVQLETPTSFYCQRYFKTELNASIVLQMEASVDECSFVKADYCSERVVNKFNDQW